MSAYAGKTVTLRHAVGGVEILFDERGSTDNKPCSWTVCGRVVISSAHVNGERIVIGGERQLLAYDAEAKRFMDVLDVLQGPPALKQRLLTHKVSGNTVEEVRRAKKVRIVIQRPGGWTEASAAESLDKVFLSARESLSDVVGPEWQPALCATAEFATLRCPTGPADQLPLGVFKAGGEVIAPKIISGPDPEYSEEARIGNYQGDLALRAVVTPEGRVSQLEIVRPAGMGLDEKALKAVSGWTFKPGTRNNEPVSVQLTITVNFRMY